VCALLASGSGFAQYRRGVNVAGAEFGAGTLPGRLGTEYRFNSEATLRYFAEKNLGLVRLPLQWERLQPAIAGPLDAAYLANIKRSVAWAKAHGGAVTLDIHNFARYRGMVTDASSLADLWVRLSSEFKFEPAVHAYNLMNEPHDMGGANWKTISQAVVSAIRANQDDKLILVPGDSWSSANRWVSVHGGSGWIQDSANNFMYEAHQYFDRDESGTYAQSYAAELAANPDLANVGRTRVARFVDWCRANSVRGMLGEYGIPDTDPRWLGVLDGFLSALDAAGMDGTYWAAGEWWGTYPLSVQPTANFTVDRPQMATLQAHLGDGYLTALSTPSVSVARATAGSLVTIYGAGLSAGIAQPGGGAWPDTLSDAMVRVTDSAGASAFAGLLYVSPEQINLQIPATIGPGRARIAVLRGSGIVASGGIQIDAAAPAIFTANSAGFGLAAAHVIRVKPDGGQVYEPVFPGPIHFDDPVERVFLALYGTGVRGSAAAVRIAGTDLRATYAGPQGQYAGVDQVNVELSRSLAGAGLVNVTVVVDGIAANTVQVEFR
jgi:endoglucanase